MSNKLMEATERIFRIPFLMMLSKGETLSTSTLIDNLRKQFDPSGHDAEIATNRNDDYFSQKVRNIKSHSSLDTYVTYDKKSGWTINSDGLVFLSSIQEEVEQIGLILDNPSFDYIDKINFIDLLILPFFPRRVVKKAASHKKVKKVVFYDENVSEGNVTTKTIQIRERSKKLRDKAIQHFTTPDGRIVCSICGYEFGKEYGEFGKGYIEIHHKKPVYQYEDKGVDTVLSEALSNLAPVCANCHRMLHHKKGMSFDDVKNEYEAAQTAKKAK